MTPVYGIRRLHNAPDTTYVRMTPVDGIRMLHNAPDTPRVNDGMRHRDRYLSFIWVWSGIAGARFTGILDPLGTW